MIIENKDLQKPISAQLEITNGCNHRCIHCYLLSPEIENRPIVESDEETVMKSARRLIDSEIFSCIVTGGEPLINKKLMKRVITLLTDNHIKVALNTNLTLLDEDIARFLAERNVSVLTSCPSSVPEHFNYLTNTMNSVLFERNLKILSDYNVYFTVNMVVTKDNINDVIPTAARVSELGCKSFGATPVSLNVGYPLPELSLSVEEIHGVVKDLIYIKDVFKMKIDIIEALPKCCLPREILNSDNNFLNRKCQAGRISVSVSSSGDVRPCGHNPESYGNILQTDIEDIFAKMKSWRLNEYVPVECRDCLWLDRCNGGCRTNAFASRKQWNGRDIWMTEPILDKKPIQKTLSADEIDFKSKNLRFNDDYRYRKESDDVFTVYNYKDRKFFMVNSELLGFIEDLSNLLDDATASYGKIQEHYNAEGNKDFEEVINVLYRKGLLYADS
jgi:radical SAM protein with 4Fe4S-binding SPASM domain